MMIPLPSLADGDAPTAAASTLAKSSTAGFWEHLATAEADADLEAALDHLATSGDEVLERIAMPRVGLPRTAGAAALRSVAVDGFARPGRG